MTVRQKIVKFFADRQNKPADFYTLMGARLARTATLGAKVQEMLAEGELVEVYQVNGVYVRLKEDDDEIVEPDIRESDDVSPEIDGVGADLPGDAPAGAV